VFLFSFVAAGLFNQRLAPDGADSATPELQRIDALPLQDVTSAEQDCGDAYQDCECHHLSSLFESSLVLLVCFSKLDAL
jgi:hypothetical protein